MDLSKTRKDVTHSSLDDTHGDESDLVKFRVGQWQQVRSWTRLIREVQRLWFVEAIELKKLGAMELSRLLSEVPPSLRSRVKRFLQNYSSLKNISSSSHNKRVS